MINKIVKGDLVQMFKDKKFDVIIHGCNCFNTMGSGIAKQIKTEFPGAYKEDCKTQAGEHKKLGLCTVYKYETGQFIVNAYTQYEYGGNHPLCYPAVYSVFNLLNKEERLHNLRIGIPKIGAGLGGGDWEYIKDMINTVTPLLDITLVEYDK